MKSNQSFGLAFIFLFLLVGGGDRAIASEGNGSSGIGNDRLRIGNGIEARVYDRTAFSVQDNQILDSSSGERLIDIDYIKKGQLAEVQGSQLIPARFGSVDGFEYAPNPSGKRRSSSVWVVCENDESCLRLTPASRTNSKVMDIIGGLRKSGAQD